MSFNWWLTYLVTTIIFSLSPGSAAVNTMSTEVGYGYRPALLSIIGLQIGLAAHIVLVGFGLGTVVAHSPVIFAGIKWLGVAYLIWLGVQQWRAAGSMELARLSDDMRIGALIRQAMFINLSNPKSVIFFAALFPQFILLQEPQLPQYTVLGVTTIAVDVVVMIGYATLAATIARQLRSPQHVKYLNRFFGALFIVVAVLLAAARQ